MTVRNDPRVGRLIFPVVFCDESSIAKRNGYEIVLLLALHISLSMAPAGETIDRSITSDISSLGTCLLLIHLSAADTLVMSDYEALR